MNVKTISVLLVTALVVLGFSGVASAATQQVLVTPAYNEQVLVTPAYNETVIDEPAYNKTVVDKDAWNETVVDVPGHYETKTVEADHNGWTLNAAKQVQQKQGKQPINAQKYKIGEVVNGYKVVDDVGHGVNKIWEAVFTTEKVWVETTYKQIEHPAETHIEEVPAKTHIVEHAAVYETVHHDAVYKTVEIPDPTVPVVEPIAEPVKKVEPKTIPMKETGGNFDGLIVALLLIAAGLVGAVLYRSR